MVDLSKAKAGDTVKFRCGGTAVIGKIEAYSSGIAKWEIVFPEHTTLGYDYANDGECGFGVLLDITEVIPAPVPEKIDAKSALYVLNSFGIQDSKSPGGARFASIRFTEGDSFVEKYYHVLRDALTHALEHDVEAV